MESAKCEAPVFRPSREEFENPFEYIESIRARAERFGICRIIPPHCWKPDLALDLSTFKFPTRVQSIHQLYKRDVVDETKDSWWESYVAFQLSLNRKQRTRNPILGGKELELRRLYTAVEKRGGYETVCRQKLWKDVARCLQVHLSNGNTTYSLRNVYEKYLKEFEERNQGKGYVRSEVEIRAVKDEATTVEAVAKKPKRDKSEETPLRHRRRRSARRVPSNLEALMCEHCGGGQFESCIILCDNCPTNRTKGYHTFCCSPPCENIPDGNFYCPECSAALFGRDCFATGPDTTYQEFTTYAEEFETNYASPKTSHLDLETDFWRIVENGDEPVEVLYGADIPTGTYGSGFPTDLKDPYASHPMNLNNLPRSPASLLSLITDDIPGVIVPWLYMGMKYSAFCWHVEDHLFYSINYLHKGAAKKWYGISSDQADVFERLLRTTLLREQLREQPDLLFHITTMVAPYRIREHGIQVCETLQEEGEFVVTFPNAYHGGFNMGLNIAEAVNFAPLHWLKFRKRASQRYIDHRKPQVISVEELVLKAALQPGGAFKGLQLYEELDKLTKEEELHRLTLWNQDVVKSMKISSSHGLKAGDSEDICCVICKDYLHVSAVVCSCCHRPVCIRHINHQCECPMSSRTLLYRFTLAELYDIRDQSHQGSRPVEAQLQGGVKRDLHSEKCEHQGSSKFAEFVEDWRRRAEKVLGSGEISASEMDTLLYEAMQFLWSGHEVDPHRRLYAKLRDSIDWYHGLEKLDHASDAKMTVEELNALINKTPHAQSHPGVLKLKEMRKEVQEWILEIERVLHPRTDVELESLLGFYEKGQKMNVLLPGLNLIRERVADVSGLQETIQGVFDPSATTPLRDLEELKTLQQRARDLKILFPGRWKLENFLLKIDDWILNARTQQDQPLTLEELYALLHEIGNVSADIPELLSLKKRLRDAEAWNAETQRAVTDCESIPDMESLLERGRTLNVIFAEMPTYESKLHQLEWKQRVGLELCSPELTMERLRTLLAEGGRLEAEGTELHQELKRKMAVAQTWKGKAETLLSRIKNPALDQEKVPFQVLQELVEDPSASEVSLGEVQECRELFQTIRPLASIIEQTMAGMQSGQSLKSWEVAPVVSQAESVAVSFEHLGELKRRITLAESFSNKAKNMLTVGLQLHHLAELKDFLKMGESFVQEHGFKIAEMDILLEWDTRLRLEWLMHRLLCDPEEEEGVEAVGLPLDTVPFSPLEILKHRFSEAVQRQGSEPAAGREERPQLDAVSAVLEQAKCVNANFHLISRLERAYAGGLKWTEYTQDTLLGNRKLKPLEILNLLQLGKDSSFKLEGIEQLEEILTAYSQWTEEVQKTLAALEKSRLPLEDVQRLLIEIQRSAVIPEGEALEKLRTVVQPALELRDSLQKELHGTLDSLYTTVQKVTSVLQYRDWKQAGFNGCYCGQLQGLEPLLTCAKCTHWYHATCIPTVTKSSRRWLCSGCKSSAHRMEAPTCLTLQNHLAAYRLLKVSMSEERVLEAMLYHYQLWLGKAEEMLKNHEANQTGPETDAAAILDVSELSCIWKQSMVIGIQCREMTERAIRALKVTQCRSLIQEHLQDRGLTAFDIPRCRKEEIPLHIIDKKPQVEIVRMFVENSVQTEDPKATDPLVPSAKAALAVVYQWEAECQELIALLNKHAGEPIENVPKELLRRTNEHIDKATTIRVRVNRDALEQLIFQSTAYCICRQTNDSERPMLACEEEDECPILWFHHRCVGLNENETPPPGYRCPHCCLRKGQAYPYALPRGSAMELARQIGATQQRTSLPVPTKPQGSSSSDPGHQIAMQGMDITSLFSDVASRWNQWTDIERLRVLEHVGECVREESRRIHEQQQRSMHYR